MIIQHLTIADNKWYILLYYGTNKYHKKDVMDTLISLGCPYKSAKHATDTVCTKLNTGLTFSNIDHRTSFVCVSDTTELPQMVNTIVHEIKHLQTHICGYYGVSEYGEQAACLTGYIAQKIYRALSNFYK